MVINHNMSAAFASRQLGVTDIGMQKNMEKLSSGQKINKAADDSAGLAISERMRSQIRGLNQASRNISDGISFVSVTEGHLSETTDILQRVRELAVQSANGIYDDSSRAQIQVEVSQLVAEIDRVASQASFNGINMLTGRFGTGSSEVMKFQIGANTDENVSINVGTMTSLALGLVGAGQDGAMQSISVADPESANMTLSVVDSALEKVSKQRADLGAFQNRFEMASNGINNAAENLQASESRIRDTDMALEMVDYTKNAVLQQAGVAMLSQAQASHSTVLQLLK